MNGGRFRELLDTLGQLVILSVLWMLLMLPVVTSVSATASLYYAVMKAVRRDRGDPVKEFFSCFRRTWKTGCLHSLLAVVLMGLMLLGALTLSPAYWLGVALLSLVLICLGPAVSRFDLKFWELWSLSFLLAVRGIPWVLLTALGAAAVALAQFFLLPMAVVLIGPGAMCLAATFPMEKVLAKAMPPKEDNEDEWYYG